MSFHSATGSAAESGWAIGNEPVARKRNRTQAERTRQVKRLNIVCSESGERRLVGQVRRPIFRYSSRVVLR
jgi:hypothetical protein